jgi:hypothetical protein
MVFTVVLLVLRRPTGFLLCEVLAPLGCGLRGLFLLTFHTFYVAVTLLRIVIVRNAARDASRLKSRSSTFEGRCRTGTFVCASSFCYSISICAPHSSLSASELAPRRFLLRTPHRGGPEVDCPGPRAPQTPCLLNLAQCLSSLCWSSSRV